MPSTFSEFERNQQGLMTTAQQNFLLRQFLFQFTLFALPLGAFIFAIFQEGGSSWAYVFILFLLVVLLRTVSVYSSELLRLPAPKFRVGIIQKFQYRGGVGVKMDALSLKCSSKLWREMKSGEQYEVFYTEQSKWLLSYQSVVKDNISTT